MKEKIKITLFGISLFYSLLVIILMVFSLMNSTINVELVDSDENRVKMNIYKHDIMLLENNNCTNTIKDMIKYYEDTSYNGEVNIKDIYDYSIEKGILSFYVDIRNNCDINDKVVEEYNLARKFLTATIQLDELFQRYYFQYEISIKDIFTRDISEAAMNNIEYRIRKDTELEIIDTLINIVNQQEVKIDE